MTYILVDSITVQTLSFFENYISMPAVDYVMTKKSKQLIVHFLKWAILSLKFGHWCTMQKLYINSQPYWESKVMPHLQAVVLAIDAILVVLYALMCVTGCWTFQQAWKKIMNNCAQVVWLHWVRFAEYAIFPPSGSTTACKRGITFRSLEVVISLLSCL